MISYDPQKDSIQTEQRNSKIRTKQDRLLIWTKVKFLQYQNHVQVYYLEGGLREEDLGAGFI